MFLREGRKICAALLLSLGAWACAVAQSSAATTQSAAVPTTYANPVIAGDYPDPSVIRVEKDYWAMATTGGWSPHFVILHSTDLVNWRVAGAVFQVKPAWAKGDFWAPEIREDGGRFFVYYTARRDEGQKKVGTLCVAVATAPRPEGPYTDHGPLVCEIPERKNVGSIDAFFIRDEAGEPYLIWKADGNDAEPDEPTSIYAQRLSADGTRLLGKRKEILRNTAPWEKHVTEGSFIIRRNGWFYHFYSGNACCGRSCDYALGVARSRKLLGPWEKNPQNPILAANDVWQCPGHGSIVTTPEGRDFLLYHAYRKGREAFHIGREALLDEVKWNADGWPTINEGRGPSGNAALPLGAGSITPASAGSVATRDEFFDGFTKQELDASWQWPLLNRQTARVETPAGFLILAAAPTLAPADSADKLTAAVLAQRVRSGDYVATTLLDARALAGDATAGLSAYSWRTDSIGVSIGGGQVFVWRREGREQVQKLAAAAAPAAQSVYLRMTVKGGEQFAFAYSVNGRDWKELGEAVRAETVEGAHIALVAGGSTGARFDWLKIISK